MPKKSPAASSSKSATKKTTAAKGSSAAGKGGAKSATKSVAKSAKSAKSAGVAVGDRELARRAQPAADRAADVGESEGIVTMVCITCGAEQFFDDRIPSTLKCKACAGTVFRQFATPAMADEATLDQLDSEARSIQYGDSSPQTTADDVRDLDLGR